MTQANEYLLRERKDFHRVHNGKKVTKISELQSDLRNELNNHFSRIIPAFNSN
jgi:hypothetical protein